MMKSILRPMRLVFLALLLMMHALGAYAALTTAQLQTLKTAILAETDPTFVAYRNNGQNTLMAEWLNQVASPVYTIWRGVLDPMMIRDGITNGITQLDALTASKRDSLFWWAQGTHDARRAEVRAAIDDLTGSQNALKTALQNAAKRLATRVETLFATGAGTPVSPGVSTLEGAITDSDVQAALAS